MIEAVREALSNDGTIASCETLSKELEDAIFQFLHHIKLYQPSVVVVQRIIAFFPQVLALKIEDRIAIQVIVTSIDAVKYVPLFAKEGLDLGIVAQHTDTKTRQK